MAASFKIGQKVQLITVVPQGPVEKLSVDQDGNIQYLIVYEDSDEKQQSRWFKEDELKSV